jgi:hypothetical protein
MTAPRSIEVGRGNPFRLGDNTPQSLAVFLRLSFFNLVEFDRIKLNIMMVLFGQSLRLVAPSRGISTPFNTVANTVESIGDGFTHFRLGITA